MFSFEKAKLYFKNMVRSSSILAAVLPLYASAFAPVQQHTIQKTVERTSSPVASLSASALETAELPEKLYFPKEKEFPKVLGGIKIGLRKLVVITGASSGLGLNCATTLAKTGRHFVVMACRDIEKGKKGKHM